MANLSNYMLTDTGRALLAKVNSGACTLKITKAKMGEAETSLNELITKTDLVGSSLRLIDISSSEAEENICNVVAIVTNEGLEQNFYVRQIGVFAEGIAATNSGTGVSPETVQETLLLVAYDSLPDILPAENTGVSITKEFNIGIIVSNAENVQVAISPAGVVTTRVLDNHDQNQNAHSNLIKKIFNASDATLESVKSSVKTWCKETISEIFGIASATTDNIKNQIKNWAQEQIESWLETLGIRYNIAQNGYICLGKSFGDAIIEWGLLILKKDHAQEPDSNFVQESLSLPLSLKIVVCGISTCNVLINTYCYIHATLPTLTIGRNPYNADTKHYYLVIGR